MAKYVTDTQALIKYLNGQKVFNNKITSIFQDTDKGKNIIVIPSVVIFEIGYLFEKGRIKISVNDICQIINNSINYVEEKLSKEIIKISFQITDIPELHDRLISGTAKYLKIPLITNDPNILKSNFVDCIRI
jgi:PIN domain nuclease of toxin-antitoxin system